MNASAKLHAREETDWRAFAGGLLEAIRGELRRQSAEIAHLKLYLTAADGHLAGNLTSNDGAVSLRGNLDRTPRDVALLINARVHVQPEVLRGAVEKSLHAATGDRIELTITNVRSFFPGRPQPTYRYRGVV
jgi:hypothetical protein